MYDRLLLAERLHALITVLERIPRRFTGITRPDDFIADEAGLDRMDAICMVLIVAGEELKQIDRRTGGSLLARYPGVKWRGAMGVRDVLAHGYLQVNPQQLFEICRRDIPDMIAALKTKLAAMGPDLPPPSRPGRVGYTDEQGHGLGFVLQLGEPSH